jgi:hypothetical protein
VIGLPNNSPLLYLLREEISNPRKPNTKDKKVIDVKGKHLTAKKSEV